MTLTTETVRVQYSGDATTTAFPVTYPFWSVDDLQVILTDASDVETTWTRGVNYTVSGGGGSTGTVTATTAPASGTTLTILSNLDDKQNTSLPAGGAFPSASVEEQLDKIVRLVQQKAEALGRALKFAVSSADSDVTFPDITGNAEKLIRVNAAGDGLEAAALSTLDGSALTIPVTVAQGGTNATTAAAARTSLGLAIGTDIPGFASANTFTKIQKWSKGADVASAAPLVLGDDGNYFDVTGTTGFGAISTKGVGTVIKLHFDDALTMTHSAALVIPGAAPVTTSAGDEVELVEYATGSWRVVNYFGDTLQNGFASAAEVEAETPIRRFVGPDQVKRSPGVPKGWATWGADGVPDTSYNVSSLTDSGAGDWTVNWATDFAGAYACIPNLEVSSDSPGTLNVYQRGKGVGSVRIITFLSATGISETGVTTVSVVALGDQ